MRVVVLALLAAGCTRDPEAKLCPPVAERDLVVTEIRRGPDGDPGGSWIELYNASGQTIDVLGTNLRFRKKDGSGETAALVRRSVEIPAGGYATFGLFLDAMRPDHIDYGFQDDFPTTFPTSAALEIDACGTRIDLATYDSLPAAGSYALGTTPPDANDNDYPSNWCTDPSATPQAANHPCM